jgi:hypothetical protein
MKKLRDMHSANQKALESNRSVLETAERDAETVEIIRSSAEQQATKLRQADHRNHYSESLTHSMRGKLA